jgi:hypothetical protein
VIHPLTDTRRILPLEKHNEIVAADADFQLTISYNPGYQSAVKDLKESTKQRFLAIDFNSASPDSVPACRPGWARRCAMPAPRSRRRAAFENS